MAQRTGYKAVVETGSCSTDFRYWEEQRDCGHLHKTMEAAERCGAKHYDAKYVNGSWVANAAWHCYRVHNQNSERVDPSGQTEYERQWDVINQVTKGWDA